MPTLQTRRRATHTAGALLALVVVLAAASPARAILIIGDNDTNGRPLGGQNLGNPGGPLLESGYQYEGAWQGFLGTVIGPNAFITAAHIGGNVGDTFSFNGTNYTATGMASVPNSPDLAIWYVNGAFAPSSWAPLYTGSDEVGLSMVAYGKGGGPGSTTGPGGIELNGWQWTGPNNQQSWGTNVVTGAGPAPGVNGEYISFEFNRALGRNTAALSPGDSGGGVFVEKNGVWYLAGVNFAADGPYNTQPGANQGSTAFFASLWDARGLYYNGETAQIAGAAEVPSSGFASRISSQAATISALVQVPEPASVALMVVGLFAVAPVVLRNRSRRDSAH